MKRKPRSQTKIGGIPISFQNYIGLERKGDLSRIVESVSDENLMRSQQMKNDNLVSKPGWNNRFNVDDMPNYDVLNDGFTQEYVNSPLFKKPVRSRPLKPVVRPPAANKKVKKERLLLRSKSVTGKRKSPKRRLGKAKLKRSDTPTIIQRNYDTQFSNGSSRRSSYTVDENLSEEILALQDKIRKLWRELHIPEKEQLHFSLTFFQDCTPENVKIMKKEIKKLTKHRDSTLLVLKHVEIRESYLARLQELVTLYEERGFNNYAALNREIREVVSKIRLATLDTVEVIENWRNQLNLPRPFIWKGEPYLIKVQTDLNFFKESALSALVEGHPDDESIVSDDSFASFDSNSEPKRGVVLPQIREPTNEFVQRIQHAAEVIANETLLTEKDIDLPMNDFIPTLKTARSVASTQEKPRLNIKLKKIKKKKIKKKKAKKNYEKQYLNPIQYSRPDYEVSFINQNYSAIKIQSVFRGYMTRKKFFILLHTHRLCHDAALIIQSAWRRFVANQIALERREYVNGADYLERTTIQRSLRRSSTRNSIESIKVQLKKLNKAALIIQTKWRQYEAVRILRNMRALREYVIIQVQCGIRSILSRWKAEDVRSRKFNAVTKLQSLFRGHKTRQGTEYAQVRHIRNDAALNIQRVFRGYRGRTEHDLWIEARSKSVVVIESLFRISLARMHVKRLKAIEEKKIKAEIGKENAALCLQATILGFLQRRTFFERKKNWEAAKRLQSMIRMWQAQSKYSYLKNLHEKAIEDLIVREYAALKIQAIGRRYLSTKQVKAYRKICNNAAIRIQTMSRVWLAVRFVRKWRSAIQIQKEARVWLAQCLVFRIKAARMIETQVLGYLARKRYPELRKEYEERILRELIEYEAVCTLQRAFRVFLAKKRIREQCVRINESLTRKLLEERSATNIQRIARGYLARSRVKKILFELPFHEAATKIQTIARSYIAKNTVIMLKMERDVRIKQEWERNAPVRELQNLSAVQIQRIARGYLAKKQVVRMRLDIAATTIQCMMRIGLAHRRVIRQKAALHIQGCAKQWLARRYVDNLRQCRNIAANKIQTFARVWLAKVFTRKWKAAIRIQTMLRGKLSRNRLAELKEMKRLNDAATEIQRLARGFFGRKFAIRWSAAMMIQRLYRVTKAKWRVAILRHNRDLAIAALRNDAAWKIQIQVRGFLARKKVYLRSITYNRAALTIQKQARVWLARRTVLKIHCALKIQSEVRGMLARIRCKKLLQSKNDEIDYFVQRELAALKIESVVRSWFARKASNFIRRSDRRNSAALSIQGCAKRYLARIRILSLRQLAEEEMKFYLEKERAALKIQQLCRIWLAKQYVKRYRIFKRKYLAAVTIQLLARKYLAKKLCSKLMKESKEHLNLLVNAEKSVLHMQRFARGYLARLRVSKIVNERNSQKTNYQAASRLQAIWIGRYERQYVNELLAHITDAQSICRTVLARGSYGHREVAAMRIQAFFKSVKVRRQVEHKRRAGALIVKVARKRLDYVNCEATKIESLIRSYLVRRRRRNHATILIQSQIRSIQQQLSYNTMLLNIAALVIQKNFKAFHLKSMAKSYVSHLQHESRTQISGLIVREYAALAIQCSWRQHLSRKVLAHKQLAHESAIRIQSFWRAILANRLRRRLKIRSGFVVLVQNRVRQILGELEFNEKMSLAVLDYADFLVGEKQESIKIESIIKIQRASRPYIARKIVDRMKEERKTRIQEKIVIEWYESHYHINHVLLVQNHLRRLITLVEMKNNLERRTEERKSAIRIQTVYRVRLAKKELIRRQKERERQIRWEQRRIKKIIECQSHVRTLNAVYRTLKMKEFFLIHQCQVQVRAILARHNTGLLKAEQYQEQQRILRELSAVLIQRSIRIHQAKSRLRKLKHEKDRKEARTLENAQRIVLERRMNKDDSQPQIDDSQKQIESDIPDDEVYLKKEKIASIDKDISSNAALVIQCTLRRALAWETIHDRKLEYQKEIDELVRKDKIDQRATVIQRVFRFREAKTILHGRKKEYERMRYEEIERERACLKIQKIIRGFLVRRKFTIVKH